MRIQSQSHTLYFALVQYALLLLLLGCDASSTARAPASKLSSEELGVRDEISKILNAATSAVSAISKHISKAEKAKAQRNFGISDTYYSEASKILYQWRDAIVIARTNNKPSLIYPESMKGIDVSLEGLRGLWLELPSTGELSVDQLNKILENLRAVVKADHSFSQALVSRKANPDLTDPKVTLAFGLRPFPFMIEILHGEFKIKQAFSMGPIDGVLGVANSGTRTGITKLVVIHKGSRRVYAVGNRKLSFEVPASKIDIDGATMTITTIDQ